jgi:hypothetical protein
MILSLIPIAVAMLGGVALLVWGVRQEIARQRVNAFWDGIYSRDDDAVQERT